MRARCKPVRLLSGFLFAVTVLLVLSGCAAPSALSKAELDAATLPDKHPKLSAEKQKAGCRSCHLEREDVKVAD